MTSVSERDTTQAPAGPGFGERRTAAWISKLVCVKGDVVCAQDLTIEGTVEGTVTVDAHNLTIGADAVIHGNLVAKTITIEGAVTGNVTARETLDLRATGSVQGDIQAPRLVMADGAHLRGRVGTETKARRS